VEALQRLSADGNIQNVARKALSCGCASEAHRYESETRYVAVHNAVCVVDLAYALADEVWGELQLLISYTDDVDQPSVFTFLTCGLLTCDMATSIEQYVGHASPKTIRKVSNPVSRGTDGSTPRPLQVSNNS
jgi:hypothetical protein